MLLFFKYDYFLKRKTAINVFFGSYRKGKYQTFNIETEPSYAETHPKTPTPTFSWYDNVKQKDVWKRNLCYIYIHLFDSGILLIIDLNKEKGKKRRGGGGEFYLWIVQLNKCYVSTV